MNKGFTTTFILVVVMALTLSSVVGIATKTIAVVRYDRILSVRAAVVMSAHACAEVALLSLREGDVSSGSINDAPISCSYSIASIGGEEYQINAVGTADGVSRTVTVVAEVTNPITVSSWNGNAW